MDDLILISNLNDFLFCPVSIYFHALYGREDHILFQTKDQLNGTHAHKAVDEGNYSTKKDIITAMEVYSEKYGVVGKIDIFEIDNSTRILDNIICDLENKFEKKFSQADSVIIFKLSSGCEVLRFGYAKNDEKDFLIVT